MPSSKPCLDPCSHPSLLVDVSPSAAKTPGFKLYFQRPTPAERRAAATTSGEIQNVRNDASTARAEAAFAHTFPAPLVLPGDYLSCHPRWYGYRSFAYWDDWRKILRMGEDIKSLKSVHVVQPPIIPDELAFMRPWATPSGHGHAERTSSVDVAESLVGYLAGHFHPIPVHLLPRRLSFAVDPKDSPTPAEPAIRLRFSGNPDDCCSEPINTRPCPDGAFPRQLDVNDILSSAYDLIDDLAQHRERKLVVVVVEQDIFSDNHRRGTGFGGDVHCRAEWLLGWQQTVWMVVSTARHHPVFFDRHLGADASKSDQEDGDSSEEDDGGSGGIDVRHVWPTSHCRHFVESLGRWRVSSGRDEGCALGVENTAMGAAMRAAVGVEERGHGAGFSRFAKGVTKWLGCALHLDPCGYYACVMQAAESVSEEVRQPPYLCPVCLKKWRRAVLAQEGQVGEAEGRELERQSYQLLREFCAKWKHVPMWAGYHAWLEKRVEDLQEEAHADADDVQVSA